MDIILGVLSLAVAALLLRALVSRTTVFEYERALRFTRGRFRGVVGPGVYWSLPFLTRLQKLDVRPVRTTIAGQEVLSADGVAVKISIAATYEIVDAERAVLGTDNYAAAIHLQLQLAARTLVGGVPIEELLARRAELQNGLKDLAAPPLRTLGIELHEAAIRDLTFPGELKKLFTQIVKARQEGLAALERARGETAALRNLANAAQMIERNPQLMQLRLLQVLGQQPGHTVVLGVQQGTTTIPVRESGAVELPPPAAPDAE